MRQEHRPLPADGLLVQRASHGIGTIIEIDTSKSVIMGTLCESLQAAWADIMITE